eukprot:gene29326-38857_t
METTDDDLETVVLINERFGFKFTFIVERIGGNGEKITLAKVSNPFKKLLITKDCLIDYVSGPPCKDNIFILCNDEQIEAGHKLFCLRTASPPTNANKKVTRNSFESSKAVAYIGTDSFGTLHVGYESPTIGGSVISFHYLAVFSTASVIADSNSMHCGIPNFISTFQCHRWQYRRFVLEGFVHFPALIEKERLDLCRKKLHRALGTPGNIVYGGVQGGEAGKFVGGLSQCGEVTQLLEGRLGVAIAAFLGNGGYDKSSLGAQIAFRFPEKESDSESLHYVPKWHTDGLRQGKAHPFSLLVGVCLSDVHSPDSGNLLLWPGSHFVMHRCKVDDHGALDLSLLHRMLSHPIFADCYTPTPPTAGAETPQENKDHDSRNEAKHDNEPNLPSLGKPVQLIASAGDCVFLHPDLAHAGGINLSADVREMIYFRLKMSGASSTAESSRLEGGNLEVVSSEWYTSENVLQDHRLFHTYPD